MCLCSTVFRHQDVCIKLLVQDSLKWHRGQGTPAIELLSCHVGKHVVSLYLVSAVSSSFLTSVFMFLFFSCLGYPEVLLVNVLQPCWPANLGATNACYSYIPPFWCFFFFLLMLHCSNTTIYSPFIPILIFLLHFFTEAPKCLIPLPSLLWICSMYSL